VNAAVALAVNVPCIFALRYNRARFQRLLISDPRYIAEVV
jgi:hypothetical protein